MPYRSHEQEEAVERSETEERVESDRELREEPVEDGHSKSESSSSSMVVSEKRLVRSATVAASRVPYSVSRIALVACGEIGFGETIWETERGRPLGMSVEAARASRREECLLEEEDLLEEDLEDLEELEDLEDLLEVDGTSRMFKTRPVVGSVVEAWAGSWETWYPSMM
jgi:hypothetical protein